MDKRQILREKSQYVRKVKKWNLLDEIQFQWLLHKMARKDDTIYTDLRPRVRDLLEKYGKDVSYIYHCKGKDYFLIQEK